jgi:hypothetical protein
MKLVVHQAEVLYNRYRRLKQLRYIQPHSSHVFCSLHDDANHDMHITSRSCRDIRISANPFSIATNHNMHVILRATPHCEEVCMEGIATNEDPAFSMFSYVYLNYSDKQGGIIRDAEVAQQNEQ